MFCNCILKQVNSFKMPPVPANITFKCLIVTDECNDNIVNN